MFKNLTIHIPLLKAGHCHPFNWNILHVYMGYVRKFSLVLVLLVFTGMVVHAQGLASATPVNGDESAIKLRLMMVEATLELNETLLQGVQASMDTLNLAANNVVQDKDMQVTLLRMRRARDKALLMPFLEHMKDSLNEEITVLRKERSTLENMVKPAEAIQPVVIKTQTLVSKKDTLVFETSITASGAEQTLVTNVKTNERIIISDELTTAERKANEKKLKKYKNLIPLDTVLVYDAGPLKPEPEKAVAAEAPAKKGKQPKVRDNPYLIQDTVLVFDEGQAITPAPAEKKEKDKKTDDVRVETDIVASDETKTKAEFYLQRAMNAMNERNFKNAETYLNKAVQLNPTYYDAWYAWAEMDARNGMDSKALKEYQKALQIDSTQWLAYYKTGIIYMKTNRKTEALENFNKAIQHNPDYIDALMQRAGIYAETNRGMDAIRDYDRVTTINRMYYKAYRARGVTKMGFKQYNEAADDFTRCLIFEPDDAEAYYYRGICRIGTQQLADGCIDLSIAQEKGYPAATNAIKKSCE